MAGGIPSLISGFVAQVYKPHRQQRFTDRHPGCVQTVCVTSTETRPASMLDQLDAGRAQAWIAEADAAIVGVVLFAEKPDRRLKLCTLYVDPAHQRRGIASALMRASAELWRDETLSEVYVTHATPEADAVAALLAPLGFRRVDLQRDRYGQGRDEAILAWRPAT